MAPISVRNHLFLWQKIEYHLYQHRKGNAVNNNLQEIYDGFAGTYEENRGLFDMTEVLNPFYESLDIEKGKLLDLGCGAGEPFARFFIDHGWKVTGVDFSKQMLKLASKYVPEMQTIQADMCEIEFESNQFDAITVIYSLFHVLSNDHAALFDKFYQWLRPKGKALFTYATREYTGSNEFDGYKEFMKQKLYYSHKSPDKLYADLKNIGFHIESTDYRNIGNEIFLWVTVSKPVTG
jgi:cyclopropane fatty-acyl-phospholipid synthase-like methyltransferase